MNDPTEAARRRMVPEMRAEAQRATELGEQTWTTEQLREEFEVEGFLAPFVIVVRKSDGQRGTLQFSHAPRIYFGWSAA